MGLKQAVNEDEGTVANSVPKHMRPAVLIVASHLQSHTKDGIHTQNMSCMQADSLHFAHLLQFLFHFLFHCSVIYIFFKKDLQLFTKQYI